MSDEDTRMKHYLKARRRGSKSDCVKLRDIPPRIPLYWIVLICWNSWVRNRRRRLADLLVRVSSTTSIYRTVPRLFNYTHIHCSEQTGSLSRIHIDIIYSKSTSTHAHPSRQGRIILFHPFISSHLLSCLPLVHPLLSPSSLMLIRASIPLPEPNP